jgi:hypothetical protein
MQLGSPQHGGWLHLYMYVIQGFGIRPESSKLGRNSPISVGSEKLPNRPNNSAQFKFLAQFNVHRDECVCVVSVSDILCNLQKQKLI